MSIADLLKFFKTVFMDAHRALRNSPPQRFALVARGGYVYPMGVA